MKEVERDHEFEQCMDIIDDKGRKSVKRCDACRIQRYTLSEVKVVRTDK